MAIQPIDLQALFTQMDKVGKNQAFIRDGQQIQDALQHLQSQRKLEENVRSVNEAQEMGEEAGKIKDEGKGREYQGGANERQPDDEEAPAEGEKRDLIKDPSLGRIIDISG
jgi:hypothetical protein